MSHLLDDDDDDLQGHQNHRELTLSTGTVLGIFLGLAVAMDYALKRTRWGRSMHAVGGNHEAARRAGINVRAIFHADAIAGQRGHRHPLRQREIVHLFIAL